MKWISVKDRLPKKDELCITSFKPVKGRVFSLERIYQVGYGISNFGSREADMWLLLPKPPTETEQSQ